MSKNAVSRLLSDADKGITQTSGTDGMLARLFREFLVSYHLSFDQWERLIREYIKEIAVEEEAMALANGTEGYVHDKDHLTSLRTNLRNALAEKTMTWPTFVKGMRFFRAHKFELTVQGVQTNTRKLIESSITVYTGEAERKINKGEFADICLNVLTGRLLQVVGLAKMEGALWEEYLDAYVKREVAANAVVSHPDSTLPPPAKSTVGSLRTNLKKNLSREAMTWRTFVTSLQFLQLGTAHITVTIYPANKAPMVQELLITVDEDFKHDD